MKMAPKCTCLCSSVTESCCVDLHVSGMPLLTNQQPFSYRAFLYAYTWCRTVLSMAVMG